MKYLLPIIILLLPFTIIKAQNTENTSTITEVIYQQYYNNKLSEGSDFTLKFVDSIAFLSKEDAKIRHFTDYKKQQNVSIIKYEGDLFKTVTPFDSLQKPEFDDQTKVILDYECRHASFFYFSNKIDVWYTDKTQVKGCPYRNYIPDNNSLVLKIVVNGNQSLVATSIKEMDNQIIPEYPFGIAAEISGAELEELKIKSRYTSLHIFENETINFDPSIPVPDISDPSPDSTYHFSKGTIILKKIVLPEINKKGAYVFAKLCCSSQGDAYDRTGSVFIIPPTQKPFTMLNAFQDSVGVLPVYTDNNERNYQGIRSEENYDPAVEIMRFFTSFGVDHFNKLREINNYPWENTAVYKQEVTSLISNNTDELWIGVFVGNYDKGGHKISLELNFYPGFEESDPAEKWIRPLFNTVNILEMSGQNYGRLFKNDTLEVSFDIPENIEDLQLLFTTTGHGGWGGGDEFNPKLNQIFLDGKQLFSVVPWRTDCATYRLLNPASGNFSNGISSSDLSRSNWCPATLTPPYVIPLNDIKTGKHTINIVIDQGDDEGNSFNHWGASGILTGTIINQ